MPLAGSGRDHRNGFDSSCAIREIGRDTGPGALRRCTAAMRSRFALWSTGIRAHKDVVRGFAKQWCYGIDGAAKTAWVDRIVVPGHWSFQAVVVPVIV